MPFARPHLRHDIGAVVRHPAQPVAAAHSLRALGLAVVAVAGAACFHKAKVALKESEAEVIVQQTLKARLWPDIHVVPDAQLKAGWTAFTSVQALNNTLAQAPVTIVAGQVAGNCATLSAGGAAAAPAAAALSTFIDPSKPIDESWLADETTGILEDLRSFSGFFEVDLLEFLESPVTGPDATIYQNLPHYPTVRQDTIQLAEALQALHSGASPTTPQIVQLADQAAHDWVKMLIEFHGANVSTEADTIGFVLTWLPLDPNRYENVVNNGLPRFAWLAEINDINLNEGNAIWANWTWDDSLVSKVQLDLSQLTTDLQTVQSAWRTQAQGLVDLSSPEAAANSLCAQSMSIAKAVSTATTGTPVQPPAIGTDLNNRISDTFKLAQQSPDPEIRGVAPTPSTAH